MSRAFVTAAWVFVVASAAPSSGEDAPALRVPARVLAVPNAPSQELPPGAQDPAAQAPNGQLPQYRDVKFRRADAEAIHAKDSTVRVLVPLPERVILVEARVTFDGLPFRAQRESRVAELLKQLQDARNEEAADGALESAEQADQPSDQPEAADPNLEAPVSEQPDEESAESGDDASPKTASAGGALASRLRRFEQATGRALSPAELHWFLANWADGPVIMMLEENFERYRAAQIPVVTLLDEDNDGAISAEELATAELRLMACDASRDGLLGYAELFAAADGLLRARPPRLATYITPTFALPIYEVSWSYLERRLAPLPGEGGETKLPKGLERFDATGDGRLDESEVAQLSSAAADVVLRVDFHSKEPAQSALEIVSIDGRLGEPVASVQSPSAVVVRIGGALLEFSAVVSSNHAASDQVSMGAMHDGYPLLPWMDPNADAQVTLRELRGAAARLSPLDTNQDGTLSADELLPTLRICVGRGPTVHQHLSQLRSMANPVTRPTASVPEWFARMDKNQDRDLTRGEFLGNDQQFEKLDADGDGLIHVTEAGSAGD